LDWGIPYKFGDRPVRSERKERGERELPFWAIAFKELIEGIYHKQTLTDF